MKVCPFCFNAYVDANLPKTEEEEYFGTDLTDDNDGSSHGIGHAVSGYQVYFNSGMGVPCNIELCHWHEGYGWSHVAKYYPKYCPECGRKLDEYEVGERGAKYDRKREVKL